MAHNVPSPLRQKVLQTFRRHKTPLQMEVELPSLEAIKRFVERGNGVALVPRLTVERELASGTLVSVIGAGVACGAQAAAGVSEAGGIEPCGSGFFARGGEPCEEVWRSVLFCRGSWGEDVRRWGDAKKKFVGSGTFLGNRRL